LGKKRTNIDFIRKTDYNEKEEWLKSVGLTVTRVVLKSSRQSFKFAYCVD